MLLLTEDLKQLRYSHKGSQRKINAKIKYSEEYLFNEQKLVLTFWGLASVAEIEAKSFNLATP